MCNSKRHHCGWLEILTVLLSYCINNKQWNCSWHLIFDQKHYSAMLLGVEVWGVQQLAIKLQLPIFVPQHKWLLGCMWWMMRWFWLVTRLSACPQRGFCLPIQAKSGTYFSVAGLKFGKSRLFIGFIFKVNLRL